MPDLVKPETSLSNLIATARQYEVIFGNLPPDLLPKNEAQAYAIQQEILKDRNQPIGGWKVGAPSPDAPIRCAPLPEDCVFKSPVTLPHDGFARNGLELEIAFCFGRHFDPSTTPYSDEEVWQGVQYVAAAIEVVTSRFKEWPEVDKLAQLADLQNNGALVVGSFTPYKDTFPFLAPSMSLSYGGVNVGKKIAANPAGDPRRLLPWLVNHSTLQGKKFNKGAVVTTGSYTGMYYPNKPGIAIGLIDGIPPVRLTLK